MKNPSGIVQYRDNFSPRRSLECRFLKVGVGEVFTQQFFLRFSFTPLILTIDGNIARLGWYLIWSLCSEVLTTVCSKILKGIVFCLVLPFLVYLCIFFYFGLATGMASEMFSLLCVGCIKGDGTFLDSIVTQYDR